MDERLERDVDTVPGPPPLGRRRFLGVLGAALFGFAARALVPQSAVAAPTPSGCFGAPGCDTCNGCICTGCHNGRAYTCREGRTCWHFRGPRNSSGCRPLYRCCDWYRSDRSVCICKCFVRNEC